MKKKFNLGINFIGFLALTSCGGTPASNISSDLGPDSETSSSEVITTFTVRFFVDGSLIETLSNVEKNSTISAPSSEKLPEGYVIKDWYFNDGSSKTVWSFKTDKVSADLDLHADFECDGYSVTLVDPLLGNSTVTKSVTYKSAYDFSDLDWSFGENLTEFEDESGKAYALTGTWMTTSDLTLYAKWPTDSLFSKPLVDSKTQQVAFGVYPQEHVSDKKTLAALETVDVEYVGDIGRYLLDDCYYSERNGSGMYFDFSDGTEVKNNDYSTHWFKWKPIIWKILSSSNGTYSLISSAILTTARYNSSSEIKKNADGYYANNYGNSDIRKWLNNSFYESAFSKEDSLIQTVNVDNSASSTGFSTNYYACSDTNDKVYLPSWSDCLNESFPLDSKGTDFCGILYNHDISRTTYWTRSPSPNSPILAIIGNWTDSLVEVVKDAVAYQYGIRPAITISLD